MPEEFDPDVEKEIEETDDDGNGSPEGVAEEIGKQLADYSTGKLAGDAKGGAIDHLESFANVRLSEKERTEALAQIGKSLDAMVKGDIPHLRERLKELGLSTEELDKVEKKLAAQVEAARPVQEAILKGDMKSLQKMVAEMKPEQMKEIVELLQKHFDKLGMGIVLDYNNGQLIVSQQHGDRAVLISKDKLDVIGVNKDGSYDFNRAFRRENPAAELQGMTDRALTSYLYPPRPIREFPPSWREIQPYPGGSHIEGGSSSWKKQLPEQGHSSAGPKKAK